ncbi:hypothetical protein ACMXYO_05670 [Neptuniibacter sp. QD37_6]|uniref:hypothetical protein n=1 Tax=Neptuniibacter sp. QD37_6 TaxID=3398210 RepID=UPI0039F570D6
MKNKALIFFMLFSSFKVSAEIDSPQQCFDEKVKEWRDTLQLDEHSIPGRNLRWEFEEECEQELQHSTLPSPTQATASNSKEFFNKSFSYEIDFTNLEDVTNALHALVDFERDIEQERSEITRPFKDEVMALLSEIDRLDTQERRDNKSARDSSKAKYESESNEIDDHLYQINKKIKSLSIKKRMIDNSLSHEQEILRDKKLDEEIEALKSKKDSLQQKKSKLYDAHKEALRTDSISYEAEQNKLRKRKDLLDRRIEEIDDEFHSKYDFSELKDKLIYAELDIKAKITREKRKKALISLRNKAKITEEEYFVPIFECSAKGAFYCFSSSNKIYAIKNTVTVSNNSKAKAAIYEEVGQGEVQDYYKDRSSASAEALIGRKTYTAAMITEQISQQAKIWISGTNRKPHIFMARKDR